ncbi:MAG: DUF420 domain-containing protein [Planctomycetes bacterium]|nr:DUF420 domain-containing protein [Planctomycetota bacterium]
MNKLPNRSDWLNWSWMVGPWLRVDLAGRCQFWNKLRGHGRQTLLALCAVILSAADWTPTASLYSDFPASVAPFSLTERSGRTVTLDDLKAKVWVAHFFFRCCSQGCAETTAAMARLQDAFARDPNVVLVSFTLDPENDTAEELQSYAAEHGADAERWLFLTGPRQTIHDLVRASFLHSVETKDNVSRDKSISHTFNLFVVDGDGRVRGYADGKSAESIDRLAARVRELTRPPLIYPTINAVLNGVAGVLLIAGYIAIRRRREILHKAIMLSALFVSMVFLAFYLYYHLVILKGHSVPFQGEGWVRPLYFVILISHIALAPIVAIMALATTFLGLKNRRDHHRRLARWTWPLWMYVSVTGVMVYVMLYHLA